MSTNYHEEESKTVSLLYKIVFRTKCKMSSKYEQTTHDNKAFTCFAILSPYVWSVFSCPSVSGILVSMWNKSVHIKENDTGSLLNLGKMDSGCAKECDTMWQHFCEVSYSEIKEKSCQYIYQIHYCWLQIGGTQ